ncbi:sensor histidine kinase [Massilia scottii]|uniref:sensor histidine kinase n=1 Tax=Massilia scottii TaxID=3057166 RepID=UPI0027966943|nr:HAMP domain-containing sensor histidine kinase [Massilia sp. CCM 9029]MDQ1830768.1 HAMP domain-containing sensor histidine kinase [Massilia sp. CCM 9029]
MMFASAPAPFFTDRLRELILHWLLRWLVHNERHHAHATGRFIVLAWIGFLGMPAYYSIWTYWFPQEFESLTLRLIGAALCLPALAPGRLLRGRFVNAYLFIAVTYVLPFQFAFMYLMNHGSAVRSQSLLIALTVLFHFRTRLALSACATGSVLACALFALVGEPAFMLSPTVLEQLPIYAFTIVAVSVAKAGRGALAREKLAGMAHGLASVSHELRTPLISVEANVRGIHRRITPPAQASEADWQAMGDAMARIQYEVRHMNHMIDLFLLSASAVEQQLEATEEVSMREVVESVIRRYPFAAQSQRDAVSVDIRTDFRFAGKHELSVVILLNLLRNALKALHRAGKGRIRIVVDGRPDTPRLLVIDTGCGIAARHLPMIFQRFYSYPPSSGAGIGLALCKDIIDAWQASIRCVSRELGYTMFVLEFPRVPAPPPPH